MISFTMRLTSATTVLAVFISMCHRVAGNCGDDLSGLPLNRVDEVQEFVRRRVNAYRKAYAPELGHFVESPAGIFSEVAKRKALEVPTSSLNGCAVPVEHQWSQFHPGATEDGCCPFSKNSKFNSCTDKYVRYLSKRTSITPVPNDKKNFRHVVAVSSELVDESNLEAVTDKLFHDVNASELVDASVPLTNWGVDTGSNGHGSHLLVFVVGDDSDAYPFVPFDTCPPFKGRKIPSQFPPVIDAGKNEETVQAERRLSGMHQPTAPPQASTKKAEIEEEMVTGDEPSGGCGDDGAGVTGTVSNLQEYFRQRLTAIRQTYGTARPTLVTTPAGVFSQIALQKADNVPASGITSCQVPLAHQWSDTDGGSTTCCPYAADSTKNTCCDDYVKSLYDDSTVPNDKQNFRTVIASQSTAIDSTNIDAAIDALLYDVNATELVASTNSEENWGVAVSTEEAADNNWHLVFVAGDTNDSPTTNFATCTAGSTTIDSSAAPTTSTTTTQNPDTTTNQPPSTSGASRLGLVALLLPFVAWIQAF